MKKFTTLGEYWKLSVSEQYRRAKKTKQCYGKIARGDILVCTEESLKNITPRGKTFQRMIDREWNARLKRIGQ